MIIYHLLNIKYFCMAQKLILIKKLIDDTNFSDWKTLLFSDIQKHGGHFIWLIQNPMPPFLNGLNQFWKDVYKSWDILSSSQKKEPQTQPLLWWLCLCCYHNQHTSTGIQINRKL
jgi:hypothetical protein